MRSRLAGEFPVSVAVGFLASCLAISPLVAEEPLPVADDIFHSTNLLHLAIEIPAEGVQALQSTYAGRSATEKPEAQARVTEGGRVYTNVSVQLKGFTTFDSIDRRPSLTLNFNKTAPKQKFHGLTKISLNNSYQDITRLHEKFSREMFAAAGVPVPRADHALVTLNGRDLGLYVLTEGFSKEFLKQHFKRADGTLYEGGTLRDITQGLRINSGGQTTNKAIVQRLIDASREPDAGKRLHELEAVLDLDRFLSMTAMETILCHSDTYSMNRNNYRIYHDPTTDKLVFMPHGMDRVLGTHRSQLDLSVVPTMLGIVARAVISTPEGRRRHVERVGAFLTNHFDPDRLCGRVHEMNDIIISFKTNELATRRFDSRPDHGPTQDADDLCARISERAAEVKFQLSDVRELLTAPPVPEFGTNRIALLNGWKPKRPVSQPASRFETTMENDVLHLHSTNTPLMASLRNRITLPLGNYRLLGENIVTNSAGTTNPITLKLVRYSSDRFAIGEQFLKGRSINLPFQVNPMLAPEEIELICEIRDDGSDVWFDPRALKLIRLEMPFASP